MSTSLWSRLTAASTPRDAEVEADEPLCDAANTPQQTELESEVEVREESSYVPEHSDECEQETKVMSDSDTDSKLDGLLKRINHLTRQTDGNSLESHYSSEAELPSEPAPTDSFSVDALLATDREADFIPQEPRSWQRAGITEAEVEQLVLKFLLARGEATGRDVSDQIKIPFMLIDVLLRRMKNEQLVYYRAASEANDYVYSLTDLGRERGRRHADHCTYFGAAPVSLRDYIESVKAQSIEHQRPTAADLERAFQDLLINRKMLSRLGPAVNSGRGMFLFGSPGNGKTSIAERITKAFGAHIWIPRAINVEGDIIRVYDPMNHEAVPLPRGSGLLDGSAIDKRWVRIKRPTIVVGGELKMCNLEVTINKASGICEAPIQLKSNCGVLVIDDFGRQQMTTDELLNRWIVPLEKRYDFLNMPSGKKLQVPFDQLVIFSTNLEPRDLVDDAFLRRIPYKIEVIDPSEHEFRELFKIMCPLMGFEYQPDPIDYLIERHYKTVNRPFRCCQPRDLLSQVKNACLFNSQPLELSRDMFDYATENYFAVM